MITLSSSPSLQIQTIQQPMEAILMGILPPTAHLLKSPSTGLIQKLKSRSSQFEENVAQTKCILVKASLKALCD